MTTDSTIAAYVDPPSLSPPPGVGSLLASCRKPVTGSDYDSGERVNSTEESASNTSGQSVPFPVLHPANDLERPKIGQDVVWIRGFAFRPQVCNGGARVNQDGSTEATPLNIEDQITVRPYIVEGIDLRPVFGAPSDNDYGEARYYARNQLLACEGKQIEAELWTGKLSDGSSSTNRHLTSASVELPEGDRLLGYVTALAVLEQAINDGTCDQQGMIHCRADTATMWISEHLAHRVGDMVVTELGTIIVVGSGYTGGAPDAGTPGLDPHHANAVPSTDSGWAYATTVVDVRRSDFITPQHVLERVEFRNVSGSQTLTTYERRVAAATWGCLHAGVHVDHVNKILSTGS